VPWWKALSEYPTEASVHVGLAIIAVCAYAWHRRRAHPVPHLGFWLCLAAFFFVMSLGPNLHVAGSEVRLGPPIRFMGRDDVNWLALPYAWLWVLFPPWRLAGVPVRMMVMVQLVAAVLASAGVRAMLAERRGWLLAAALLVTAIEYWPAPMRLTDPAVPAYVEELRDLPGGAVLDLASNAPLAMYYQTIHGKPIAFGYISRTPASVDAQDQELAALIRAGQWDTAASRFGFRYVVARDRAADVMVRGVTDVVLPPIAVDRRRSLSGDVAIYEF